MTHSDVFSKLRSDLPNRQSTSPRIVITDSYADRDNTTGSYNNYATTVELLQQTLKEKDRLIRHMDKIINLLITNNNNNATNNFIEGAKKKR